MNNNRAYFQKEASYKRVLTIPLAFQHTFTLDPRMAVEARLEGAMIYVRCLNIFTGAPLVLKDKDQWIIPPGWVDQYLRRPGIREISWQQWDKQLLKLVG